MDKVFLQFGPRWVKTSKDGYSPEIKVVQEDGVVIEDNFEGWASAVNFCKNYYPHFEVMDLRKKLK